MSQNFRKIIFGLGSNLGNRAQNLARATELLITNLELKNHKISQIFENKALLKSDAPKEWDIDFFNIAISAQIDLETFAPEKILQKIKEIEKIIGRSNRDSIWAPREIDVDILAIEDLIFSQDNLQIPHKSLLQRDFFLKVFAEIEPNWIFPIKGKFFGKRIDDIANEFLK